MGDKKILEAPLTKMADTMTVENVTAASVCAFTDSHYYKEDFSLSIKQIKNQDILLYDSSLTHATSFRASSACTVLIICAAYSL